MKTLIENIQKRIADAKQNILDCFGEDFLDEDSDTSMLEPDEREVLLSDLRAQHELKWVLSELEKGVTLYVVTARLGCDDASEQGVFVCESDAQVRVAAINSGKWDKEATHQAKYETVTLSFPPTNS